MTHSRRTFLAGAGALASAAVLTPATATAAGEADPWRQVPRIMARVRPPRIPRRDFVVTGFGADPAAGAASNTAAFARAVAACSAAGGGRVVVPPGTFRTGPIHLRSNVELHVGAGATVKFSTDPADYLPLVLTRWEGTLCYNYSPFIYAFEQRNLAITGSGTLDGDAVNGEWRGWGAGATQELRRMGEEGVPVERRIFGPGKRLRPNMIQFFRCRNIAVSDVFITNPAMWSLHFVFSRNITVRDIHILTTNSQGDGVDLDSSSFAYVADSRFNTNDDCVVLKSGRDADGRQVGIPTSHVVVERCKFSGRWGGITVGSEMSGGVHTAFARDCEINAPDFPGRYPVKHALYIKTNSDRGGYVDGIHLRDFTGRDVEREILDVSMFYNGGGTKGHYPRIRNITVDRMRIDGGRVAANFEGLPQSHIRDVLISDSTFTRIAQPNHLIDTDNLRFRNTTINGRPAG
ncbi:glycoside hydrolase family 28 protein [Amycolatopsis suaedae]|uniref:Glycoside hydrolase family 28 protein n=1 Tax=Amycolatopsis suaedae TaxID=2510978 RepID=A0A4Q7IZW9_9PSEU|nr:glycoside hydrolase family 28 protein [Amycolatopsis suaedae]RZQ60611.1 glycoside hydrolase family 28 protein [Amycolatopsis suaedae]